MPWKCKQRPKWPRNNPPLLRNWQPMPGPLWEPVGGNGRSASVQAGLPLQPPGPEEQRDPSSLTNSTGQTLARQLLICDVSWCFFITVTAYPWCLQHPVQAPTFSCPSGRAILLISFSRREELLAPSEDSAIGQPDKQDANVQMYLEPSLWYRSGWGDTFLQVVSQTQRVLVKGIGWLRAADRDGETWGLSFFVV